MIVPIVLVTVCLASSTILAAYEKPFYAEEDAESLFMDFLKEHNKVYNRREYHERLEIFKNSLKDINERNAKFPNTVFAVNYFADLKPHERQQYRGFKMVNETVPKLEITDKWSAPASLDWRNKNAVTRVKHQGHCGSCYIFSAVGEIEGQYAIKTNQLLALSEQQVLDCLPCGSCGGGQMESVSQELAAQSMKLEGETDYPYTGIKRICEYDASKGIVQAAAGTVFKMDEESLKAKLANHGPISIALSSADFDAYQGGILVPNACTGRGIDHAVLLVGYGEEGGQQYWIIKNSWGAYWGEKGYVRLQLGVKACAIGSYLVTSSVV